MKRYTEKELLKIAGEQVRAPWEKWVAAAAAVFQGRPMSAGEDRIALPLTPFTVDYSAMYPVMRDFVGLMTWDPCNLFTIILDRKGEKVLRAYLEVTRDNNFVEMIRIEPADALLDGALGIFHSEEKRATLRRVLDARCKERFGQGVNWVKIASIDFFGAMAPAAEAFTAKGLHGWFAAVFEAVRCVYEKSLIHFVPEPPAFARLREQITSILHIDFAHLDLDGLLGSDPGRGPSEKTVAIVLRGRDYVTALKLGGADPMHLTYPKSATDVLLDVPMKKLATEARRLLGCDLAFAVRTEPVANIAYEAMFHEMPYEREDMKFVLYRALELVRQFGKLWSIDPMPFYLRDWVRVPGKIVGSPYDISNLASWLFPKLIFDGEPLFLGQYNNRTNIILDGTKILAAVTMEMYNGGIRSVTTRDPALLADIFAKRAATADEAKAQATEAAWRLWEAGYGFQNQTAVIQKEFSGALGEVMSLQTFKSVFRAWRVVPAALRVYRLAKAGGMGMYPDLLMRKVEQWVKQAGRRKIYSALVTIPFDFKRGRTRGLLYVKSTITAAAILGVLTYFFLK